MSINCKNQVKKNYHSKRFLNSSIFRFFLHFCCYFGAYYFPPQFYTKVPASDSSLFIFDVLGIISMIENNTEDLEKSFASTYVDSTVNDSHNESTVTEATTQAFSEATTGQGSEFWRERPLKETFALFNFVLHKLHKNIIPVFRHTKAVSLQILTPDGNILLEFTIEEQNEPSTLNLQESLDAIFEKISILKQLNKLFILEYSQSPKITSNFHSESLDLIHGFKITIKINQ